MTLSQCCHRDQLTPRIPQMEECTACLQTVLYFIPVNCAVKCRTKRAYVLTQSQHGAFYYNMFNLVFLSSIDLIFTSHLTLDGDHRMSRVVSQQDTEARFRSTFA
mgnify:CR=1 FL=1